MSPEIRAWPEGIWFSNEGPEHDTVFSSRARLSRNISGIRFPGTFEEADRQLVRSKTTEAFSAIGAEYGINLCALKDLGRLQKQIVLERNLLSQDYSLDPENLLFTDPDNCFAAVVNDIDHLRFSFIEPGLSLEKVLKKVVEIDQILEKKIEWSASLEWGYQSSEWYNVGTGLKISVLFHLPALARTQMVEKASRTVAALGLDIRGWVSDDGNSLGDLYQVSSQLGFGQSEEDAVLLLKDVSSRLVQLERTARGQLLELDLLGTSDRIARAFGLLKYCRKLGLQEALGALSEVRLGICLGMIKDVHLRRITALFFLVQQAHVQGLGIIRDPGHTDLDIEAVRADLVRTELQNATYKEAGHV